MAEQLKIVIDADVRGAEAKVMSFGKTFVDQFNKINNSADALSASINSSINKINASLSSLKVTSVDISVDTSAIDASVKDIQAKFANLVNPEINVLANTEQAEIQIKELISELGTLKGSEIFIRANDTQALAAINTIEAELKGILDKTIKINVNALGVTATAEKIAFIEKSLIDLEALKVSPNISSTQLLLFEKNILRLKAELAELKRQPIVIPIKAPKIPPIPPIVVPPIVIPPIGPRIKQIAVEAEKAGSTISNSFNKAFNGAKQLANIIPGLGISTLLLIASDALIDLAKSFLKASEAAAKNSDIIAEAGNDYKTAVSNVNQLKTEIGLAKDGFLNKDAVVKHYNETIGKTTGLVKNLDEAEQALNRNADAYIKFTLLKAAANVAQGKAAEQLFSKAIQEQKDFEKNFADFGKKQAKGKVSLGATDVGEGDLTALQRQQLEAQKKTKAIFDKRIKGFEDIAKDFNTQAALIASSFKFDFFGDQKAIVPKDETDKILARARQFVKEFGDAFVLPNLDETFFKGVKELLPEAKKLLQDVAKGNLQIKIPVFTDFEFLPTETPLSKEQLDELTKGFFKGIAAERGIPIDIVFDPSLNVDNTKLINSKVELKKTFEDTFGKIGIKAFGEINFDNLKEGVIEANALFLEMKANLLATADLVTGVLAPAFGSMFDAIIDGEKPLKAFFKGLTDSVNQLIKRLIAAAIQAAVLSALSGGATSFGSAFSKLLGFAGGGRANFGLGGAIGSRSFQNTLQVVVTGQISGSTINLAGQRAAISNQRGG